MPTKGLFYISGSFLFLSFFGLCFSTAVSSSLVSFPPFPSPRICFGVLLQPLSLMVGPWISRQPTMSFVLMLDALEVRPSSLLLYRPHLFPSHLRHHWIPGELFDNAKAFDFEQQTSGTKLGPRTCYYLVRVPSKQGL